jgi:acyl-[acyl-carrier-protein] desaturase
MSSALLTTTASLEADLFRLYRDYFDRAEKKRRWSLRSDIPWDDCNVHLNPAVADVVESFLAVEMHLPDYVASAMMRSRASRACSWFYANWGYEESKHSLALADWLLRSGSRSEEQMADMESQIFAQTWDVPHESPVGMLAYAMVQELATGLNYRNLRERVAEEGDPALSRILGLLSVDEQAHHSFFLRAVRLFLAHDRPETLHQLHRVLHSFTMPVIYELDDGRRRVEAIKELGLFDQRIFYDHVYEPILEALGVGRSELRRAA